MSRPLWSTVTDLLESVTPRGAAAELVRVTGVSVELPVELSLRRTAGGVELLGAPPRWRWSTAFDRRPGRIRMELRPEAPLPLPDAAGGGDAIDAFEADERRARETAP